jgi:hypothetical protein
MEGTVLEVLTQPNPLLDLTFQKQGGLTRNQAYIALDPYEISTSIWKDFNYDNIVAALGHLLNHGPVKSKIVAEVRNSQTRIEEEADIDRIGDHWFTEVVYEPLKYGVVQTLRALGMAEVEVSFRLRGAKLENHVTGSKFFPDWWIYQHTKPKKTSVVVGDSKCSSKWCSNIDKNLTSRADWLLPMRQVGSYCVNGGTRYAFIVTGEELVAARFYKIQEARNPVRVEFTSIPWDAQDTNTLTMNLAIWALAIFGLNEGHRPMRDRSETLPLNVWWEDMDGAGSIVYEHHLTGRKVTELPSGGEARLRPTDIPAFQVKESGSTGLRRSKRWRQS